MKKINEVKLNQLLALAIKIASEEFQDITDKGGRPYILHCLWVMNKVRHLGTMYMIVAVLHDLLEDTDWKVNDLRSVGFPDRVILALELLDFSDCKNEEDYLSQIDKISINCDIATQVKLRDLEHNSKITRLKKDEISEKDLLRTAKYYRAYKKLEPYKK